LLVGNLEILLYIVGCGHLQTRKLEMEWLFGRQTTPEEMLRKNKRALDKAIRDLDREKARMEQQEKRIIVDIKKMAKEGQMVSNLLFSLKT